MKRSALLAPAVAFLLVAAAPPPRQVHLDIATAQSTAILAKCIEHTLSGLKVKETTLDGGATELAFSQQMNWMGRPPMEYWTITPKDGTNHLTVSYRHPMSERTAAKDLRIIGRKCFPYELEAAGGGTLPEGD